MESIIYGVVGVIGGIVALTVILYVFVNVGSWTVKTFSQVWREIIDKGYYDIFLPVCNVVKWLCIVPHSVLKALRIYYLSGLLYKMTVRNFSLWLENKGRERLKSFKDQKHESQKNNQNQQEEAKQENKEERKQEHREEPKREQSKKSPYEVLGIAQNANLDEIKKAYRDLSQQYHPDKVNHLGAELKEVADRKFKEINQAYQILKESL